MTQTTPSRSSLAEVLAAIAAGGLPKRRQQDMASAVRTVAKAIGHSPAQIPADPRRLGIRLKPLSHLALGLSEGRWNNVRSLFRAALALVTPIMPGRDETPLSEAWASLFEQIAAKRSLRIRLSRLVHWLSRHHIHPSIMSMDDLERFRAELLNDALLSRPDATWVNIRMAWNAAVKGTLEWPQLPITVVSRKVIYVQHWVAFPPSLKADVDLWLDRLAGRDFAEDGPNKPASPSTLATREYQLRAFASALAERKQNIADLTSLAACLTLDNFTEGLRFFRERDGNKNTTRVHDMAGMLKGVARHWVKADEATLVKMMAIVRKLKPEEIGMTKKNTDRVRQLEDPVMAQKFVNLPRTIRQHIDTGKLTTRTKRMLAQAAVAIELLIVAPIRIGNLTSIDLDRHLIKVGKRLHLVIPACEVKNRQDLDFELPVESAALIAWYIADVRETLPGNRALFPGKSGTAKTIGTLRGQIIRTVQEYLGLAINPHLFRHIGAKLYLDKNPGNYEVVRQVLGHKSMATTTKFYAGHQTRNATRHFDSEIIKLRDAQAAGVRT